MKLAHLLTAASLTIAGFACTTPASNPPGIGEQPNNWHPSRNPAHLPTTSMPGPTTVTPEDPSMGPIEDPDKMGTVRTPSYVDDVDPQANANANPTVTGR